MHSVSQHLLFCVAFYFTKILQSVMSIKPWDSLSENPTKLSEHKSYFKVLITSEVLPLESS